MVSLRREGQDSKAGPALRRARLNDVKRRVLQGVTEDEFRVLFDFQMVWALSGEVTREGLSKLLSRPDVLRVDLDSGGTGALAQSIPFIHADAVKARGLTGSGVTVAVLDTGIDSDHPAFAGSVMDQHCFCRNGNGSGCCPNTAIEQAGPGSAEDDNGHGTNVSGIIASQGGGGAPEGLAPAVRIVAVKVIDADNQFAFSSQVVAGLDWLLSNYPDIDLVNMSLGTAALFTGVCDTAASFTQAFAAVIDLLHDNGAAIVVSAGNNAEPTTLEAPACVKKAIAVGAVNDSDGSIAPFSNAGTALDILAPGVSITSTGNSGGTSTFSGTSQAAPHVTGTLALLRQQSPSFSNDAMEAILKETGTPTLDSRNGMSYPLLDALAAYDRTVALQRIVYPQFPLGQGFEVSLMVTNQSADPWSGKGLLDGGDWPVGRPWELNGQDRTGQSTFDIELAGNQTKVFVFTSSLAQVASGRLEIEGDVGSQLENLAAAYFYEFSSGGQLLDSTGVAPSPAVSAIRFPVERQGAVNTGVAIRNSEGDLHFTLFDESGDMVATRDMELDGGRFVNEIFDGVDTQSFVGSVLIEGTHPFNPVVLRQETTGQGFQLTSIPGTVVLP